MVPYRFFPRQIVVLDVTALFYPPPFAPHQGATFLRSSLVCGYDYQSPLLAHSVKQRLDACSAVLFFWFVFSITFASVTPSSFSCQTHACLFIPPCFYCETFFFRRFFSCVCRFARWSYSCVKIHVSSLQARLWPGVPGALFFAHCPGPGLTPFFAVRFYLFSELFFFCYGLGGSHAAHFACSNALPQCSGDKRWAALSL